jgi:hypothetical protein
MSFPLCLLQIQFKQFNTLLGVTLYLLLCAKRLGFRSKAKEKDLCFITLLSVSMSIHN